METRTLRYLGWLGKPWGHRGELALNIEAAGSGVLDMEVLFVELDGLGVPFFVAGMREVPRVGTLVKFEDIDDPQGAAFMVNAKVYAPPGHAKSGISEEEEQWSPEDLLGLQVVDEEHGPLGEVTAIEGSDDNPVMVIRSEGSEVMVPIVDELISGIDEATGQLVVRTPPGLVEFYRRG
ncbi:MAG: ribosome maturation factor RimM [Flavobacteriales bacterium]|nr:ribosome maturation factor RimM [Flavobacteriales bacterium]